MDKKEEETKKDGEVKIAIENNQEAKKDLGVQGGQKPNPIHEKCRSPGRHSGSGKKSHGRKSDHGSQVVPAGQPGQQAEAHDGAQNNPPPEGGKTAPPPEGDQKNMLNRLVDRLKSDDPKERQEGYRTLGNCATGLVVVALVAMLVVSASSTGSGGSGGGSSARTMKNNVKIKHRARDIGHMKGPPKRYVQPAAEICGTRAGNGIQATAPSSYTHGPLSIYGKFDWFPAVSVAFRKFVDSTISPNGKSHSTESSVSSRASSAGTSGTSGARKHGGWGQDIQISDSPWTVLVSVSTRGTGVIISDSWVLTHANVVVTASGDYPERTLNNHEAYITYGSNVPDKGLNATIKRCRFPPTPRNVGFVVAMCQLDKPLDLNQATVWPVCLPGPSVEKVKSQETCEFTGWTYQWSKPVSLLGAKIKLADFPVDKTTLKTDQSSCFVSPIHQPGIIDHLSSLNLISKFSILVSQGDLGGPLVCNRGGKMVAMGLQKTPNHGSSGGCSNSPQDLELIENWVGWIAETANEELV